MTIEALTVDQLKTARPDLVAELQQEGATAEHERVRTLLREPRSMAGLADRALDIANGKFTCG